MDTPNEKECRGCKETKSLDAFAKQKQGKYGRRSKCKKCLSAQHQVYKAKNADRFAQKQAERRTKAQARDMATIPLPTTITCSQCTVAKAPVEFHNNRYGKHGKVSECKDCCSIRDKKFRDNNKEKTAEWGRRYRKNNVEKIAQSKIDYRENNREAYRKTNRENKARRRATDVCFRIKQSVSASISSALARMNEKKGGASTFKHLPYTPQQLREHLENQFEDWMTWDNWGVASHDRRTWQIDHIYPHSKLPYTSMTDENFIKCWALENLQPLDAIENIKKSNKII